jgi:CheY-like chemotaxis protein
VSDLRILVVEDEPDGAEVVELLLNSVNMPSVIATTAEEALSYLQGGDHGFTIIITDLALPGMDGFELLRTIQKDPTLTNLPLIAITAFHTPELRAKALKAGFNAYLAKPLNSSLFLNTLDQVITQ